MYIIKDNKPEKIEETTFKELNKLESDLEELLRQNIDMICDTDESSMLVVGQQVRNESNGRSDLTAVDNEGNIILIEIKRDADDIIHRKEAFEFQAIRYAANCASIQSTDELIQKIYSPYIEKHKEEFQTEYDNGLTSVEIAKRKLSDFFSTVGNPTFNRKQRIFLVASNFDEQTLSAVAWLNSNNVDISCYQILPHCLDGNVLIDIKKVLPLDKYEDYYVKVATSSQSNSKSKSSVSSDITRRNFPRIEKLLEDGVVKAGDIIIAKSTTEEAVLQSDGRVKLNDGTIKTLAKWLKDIYGWSAVQTYVFAIRKEDGKSLSELREAAYMNENENNES